MGDVTRKRQLIDHLLQPLLAVAVPLVADVIEHQLADRTIGEDWQRRCHVVMGRFADAEIARFVSGNRGEIGKFKNLGYREPKSEINRLESRAPVFQFWCLYARELNSTPSHPVSEVLYQRKINLFNKL